MDDPFAGWAVGPTQPRFEGDEIHVWGWQLEGGVADLATVRGVLSGDEIKRMRAFRFTPDRERYARARAGLRHILGRYLGLAAEAVRFEYGEFGKPGLEPALGRLEFNLSHSQGIAVAALCSAGPVGVDVEHRRPVSRALAEQVFSPGELGTLHHLSNEEYETAFFNGWTRKEAVCKAEGLGFHLPAQNFSVSLLPGEMATVEDTGGVLSRIWRLEELPLGGETVGCVAVDALGPLRLFRMS